MKQRSFVKIFAIHLVLLTLVSFGHADSITNPWDNGTYKADTKVTAQLGRFDDLLLFGTSTIYGPLVFEGTTYDDFQTTFGLTDPTADRTITFPDASGTVALTPFNAYEFEGVTADDFETTMAATDPTADNTIALPNYSGAVPLVVQQGYTQFSHSEATTVDVTGAALSLADGWFTEGKVFRVKAGGTVTGANGAITVALFLEDGAVCTLTTADAAAGDWVAEFTVLATGAATQRLIGNLVAGGGTDFKTDYATDATDTATSGTIPLKLQVGLANAADTITCEYWSIEHFDKAD
jgi:hypothetical protein